MAKLMTRKEFIDALQSNTEEITGVRWCKEDCNALIDIFTVTVERCLVEGKSPNIVGFGRFEVKERQATRRLHPITGEFVELPAHRSPVFKPGAILKKSVNKESKDEEI